MEERGSVSWNTAVVSSSRCKRILPTTVKAASHHRLLAANTLIYLRPLFLDFLLPFVDEVWFNPHLFLKALQCMIS
ncbi:hypothetical protein PVK06_008904 [Gossypium arboreum]|uniref:Uncharacterized protein n=1 Tax=Gossypium arboreum TaxID=29729 RepID=A0ABR0QMF5_GOSAR|nr:hypothetical protein PVK06_008904 [Gossypium arboreum]